ncbi:MAG: DUF5777 family beta-barrel protein [Terriglobales bacterium]|jgi:hypothetical protein
MFVSGSFARLLASAVMVTAGITIAAAQVSAPLPAAASSRLAVSARDLGITFLPGSASQLVIERDGKRYIVDLATSSIREADLSMAEDSPTSPAAPAAQTTSGSKTSAVAEADKKTAAKIYTPADDSLFSVPTGRRLERHGLYLNFTHRFPFEPAFSSPGRGDTLLGLDDFSISSFGLRYGVTSKFSVMAYRSPSEIGRPIELMAAYNFLNESDGQPFNAALRFSVDGQNDFAANYTENFELVASRSLGHRAQLYAAPTFSIHQRPLLANPTIPNNSLADPVPDQPCSALAAVALAASFRARPCANTFSLAMGAAVGFRPTVALIAETIPTLVNGTELAIHRPEFSFGIQKRLWRHAFTLGFTNSPGTIVSERSGTNATFTGNPSADKPSKVFIGFDLTRQLF